MKFHTTLIATCAVLGIAAIAFAQHDHAHPDIELELEGTEIHIHGPGVIHNHEHYEFVKPGSNWQTFHDTLNWPGVSSAEDGGGFTAGDSGKTFNFVTQSQLYYWDGVGAVTNSNFTTVTGNTYVEVSDAGFVSSIEVNSSSSTKTLNTIASITGTGDIHTHPVWRLFDDDGNPGTDPADGAYFFLFYMDPSDVAWSNSDTVGLLFHKGLSEAQYESAAESAGAQFGLTVPEPASAVLLALGTTALLLRRRSS